MNFNRLLAIFELLKGLTAVVVMLLFIEHKISFSKLPHPLQAFIGHITTETLIVFGVFTVLYTALHTAEFYGLWFNKKWGPKFVMLSIGIYIPVEIYELVIKFSVLKVVVLVLNICVLIYFYVKRKK